MALSNGKALELDVLLSRDDGLWIAECPQIGVLVADPDLETAWEDATRACRAHLLYAIRTGIDLHDVIKPPPDNLAEIIRQARKDQRLIVELNCKTVEIRRCLRAA